MAGKPNPDDGAWVRGAVVRFESPLTLYAARLLGDAESAHDVVRRPFSACVPRTVSRLNPGWPNGSSRSAATGHSTS